MNTYQAQQFWNSINGIVGFSASIMAMSFMVGMARTILGSSTSLDNPTDVAYQYEIQERMREKAGILPVLKLENSEIRKIDLATARDFIERYEWLGYLCPTLYRYGLYWEDKLGCVVCFSKPPAWQAARSICGKEYEDKVLLLSRGACTEWTPRYSASYSISRVLKLIEAETPYRIITAYADPRAGEIGTIYQALNWLYIGTTEKRVFYVPRGMYDTSGPEFSTRYIPKEYKSKASIEALGYEVEVVENPIKHRYVTFLGDKRERREYMRNLQLKVLPYPKRTKTIAGD